MIQVSESKFELELLLHIGDRLIEMSVFVEGNQDVCPIGDKLSLAKKGLSIRVDIRDVGQQHQALLHVV